jgi:hypothetical protein
MNDNKDFISKVVFREDSDWRDKDPWIGECPSMKRLFNLNDSICNHV